MLQPDDTHGGSQALDLQPSQGGYVEFSFDEDGLYPIVTHKFSNASTGAMGLFQSGGRHLPTSAGMTTLPDRASQQVSERSHPMWPMPTEGIGTSARQGMECSSSNTGSTAGLQGFGGRPLSRAARQTASAARRTTG